MDPAAVVDDFRAQHRRIDEQLAACEDLAAQVDALQARLLALRPVLLDHLDAKDAFYVRLVRECAREGDLAQANVAQMFEGNMKVQSAAVRRFFAALDTPGSPLLAQSFKTMALIIRGRLSQEERAVFPLFLKAAAQE
jgi:uncharacterized protein YigA (DUF484 family)